jgi:hypothetical protein
MYIFEISIKRRFFITRSTFSKKKSFHLKERSTFTFYELKKCPKWKHPLNISKTDLRFSSPFQIFMPDIWVSKEETGADGTEMSVILICSAQFRNTKYPKG